MRALNRKLIRELWRNAGSLALVILIIGIGVACFIGLGTAIRVLSSSQAEYYREYRFADFWVELKKAPLTAVQQVARLPGVDRVEGRIVFDVILDVPGEAQPLTGRLISVPPQRLDQVLNGLCLVRGSTFSDDRDEEVILSESFAREHGLGPGDRIGLIVNRKQESFIIAGTAISPEYVYMIRGEGDFLPDPRHFGILYVKEDFARDVLDFQDACNQIVGRFVPGAAEEFVLRRIERELDPYGVYAATPRERQASHRVLTDEIVQQKNASTLIPAIFLAVAALVLNVLMSRLAERQRTVIGTLKALGYYNRTVLWHFVSFGLAVGLVGGVIGDLLGIWVAHGMVRLYAAIFQFPQFDFRIHADLLAAGLLISVAFSAAGTLRGVWNVLRLHPAEAMRERPPEHGGAIFLERWPWLWRRLGFRTHMALRGLLRHPVRTLTGMLSTGLATGIMFLSLTLLGSIWFLIDYQLEYVLTSDVDIAMRDPQSVAALLEARQLPGVDYAEPLLGVTADLRNGRYSRRLGVLGLSPGHRLTTPMQRDRTPVEIPADGIVMTAKLAEILELRVGDRFELTPVRGRRETVHARRRQLPRARLLRRSGLPEPDRRRAARRKQCADARRPRPAGRAVSRDQAASQRAGTERAGGPQGDRGGDADRRHRPRPQRADLLRRRDRLRQHPQQRDGRAWRPHPRSFDAAGARVHAGRSGRHLLSPDRGRLRLRPAPGLSDRLRARAVGRREHAHGTGAPAHNDSSGDVRDRNRAARDFRARCASRDLSAAPPPRLARRHQGEGVSRERQAPRARSAESGPDSRPLPAVGGRAKLLH